MQSAKLCAFVPEYSLNDGSTRKCGTSGRRNCDLSVLLKRACPSLAEHHVRATDKGNVRNFFLSRPNELNVTQSTVFLLM